MTGAVDWRIAAVHRLAGAHLEEIRALYKVPVRISLVVRDPAHPDGSRDMLMTDDYSEAIINTIRQRVAQPPTIDATAEVLP